MAYALVSVDERMIRDEGLAESGRLFFKTCIEIGVAERHARLRECGFQRGKVTQTG